MKNSKLSLDNHNHVTLFHQGAHLTSWVHQDKEQLFLSESALFEKNKAIRGGVPIIFPQFGAFGTGKKHGFARQAHWEPLETQEEHRLSFVTNNTLAATDFPFEFSASFDLWLSPSQLKMKLSIENRSQSTMEFTAALHTYFRVQDIQSTQLQGLNNTLYWDNGNDFSKRQTLTQESMTFSQAIDRVFFKPQTSLKLVEAHQCRHIEQTGFEDVVVWNPWDRGAKSLADMNENEYKEMLCIEAAQVDNPIVLAPQNVWFGEQIVTIASPHESTEP